MITTKTKIAIIENNQAFSGLLKSMLFKVGALSQYHFASTDKFLSQIEKKKSAFDLVIFNSRYSDKVLIERLNENKMKYLAYGEKDKMTTELISLAGLTHLIELPFTSEKLLQKIERINS